MNSIENDSCACIIVNYNDAKNTINLAKDIYGYKNIHYIIIIDNCSSDGSFEEIKRLENQKIIVIKNMHNAGYGAGNNLGIKLAKQQFDCKYALIANPDVSFTDECVKSLIICLKEKKCAVAAPVQLNHSGVITNPAWNLPSYKSYIFTALYLGRKIFDKSCKIPQHEKYVSVDCVTGAFLAVNIECFLSVGGYDDDVFLYCEEVILGLKMKAAGYSTLLLTEERYLHVHGASTSKSIPSAVKRQRLLLNSRLLVIKKYYHKNGVEIAFIRFIYNVSILEECLKVLIKRII